MTIDLSMIEGRNLKAWVLGSVLTIIGLAIMAYDFITNNVKYYFYEIMVNTTALIGFVITVIGLLVLASKFKQWVQRN